MHGLSLRKLDVARIRVVVDLELHRGNLLRRRRSARAARRRRSTYGTTGSCRPEVSHRDAGEPDMPSGRLQHCTFVEHERPRVARFDKPFGRRRGSDQDAARTVRDRRFRPLRRPPRKVNHSPTTTPARRRTVSPAERSTASPSTLAASPISIWNARPLSCSCASRQRLCPMFVPHARVTLPQAGRGEWWRVGASDRRRSALRYRSGCGHSASVRLVRPWTLRLFDDDLS